MKSSQLKKANIKSQKVVGIKEYRDVETGEVLPMSVVETTVKNDIGWHKIWLADLAGILRFFGSGKFNVFSYVIDNTDTGSNLFLSTVREVAKDCGVSTKTVAETFKILMEANFMVKVRNGQYRVNPEVMAYGSSEKRGCLLVKYHDEKAKKEDIEEEKNAELVLKAVK